MQTELARGVALPRDTPAKAGTPLFIVHCLQKQAYSINLGMQATEELDSAHKVPDSALRTQASGKWLQEEQKFKVILKGIGSSRSAWARDLASQRRKNVVHICNGILTGVEEI